MLRSEIVPLREYQQFPLRIWELAFAGYVADPLGQLAIMRSAVPQPVTIRTAAVSYNLRMFWSVIPHVMAVPFERGLSGRIIVLQLRCC